MIDAFPFEAFFTPEGAVDERITSFWPYAGDAALTESLTDASTGTWVLTILGMILTAAALVAWVVYEKRRLDEATARLRAERKWTH